ncbi:MAG TPA: GNAT family N-acetyltransferase [Pseudonocardia sp.]|jgi:RimJ/RimL family protein N-acetyltransferase
MALSLTTERLRVRPWGLADADAALAIYGVADVTGWLTPATNRVGDRQAMLSVLRTWVHDQPELPPPRGRWAMERRADGAVVGGLAIRPLPPAQEDLEISFQVRPDEWGNGYAAESAGQLIRWALTQDVDELFGVALPHNSRAIATMIRLGMEWVGETGKYYDHTLSVYRIRLGEVS